MSTVELLKNAEREARLAYEAHPFGDALHVWALASRTLANEVAMRLQLEATR